MAPIIRKREETARRILLVYQSMQRIREWFSLGVLGLNSFIMLYYRSTRSSIQYVVCAGAVGYSLVLFFQSIVYRHCPARRMEILKLSQKAFRLLYTAIYLTSIMLHILAASQEKDSTPLLVYYGLVFLWAALWGTNCFWLNRLIAAVKSCIRRGKGKTASKAAQEDTACTIRE